MAETTSIGGITTASTSILPTNLFETETAGGASEKTTFQTMLDGTAAKLTGYTGGSAIPAGKVGEFLQANVQRGSATALTSGTPKNVTSLALTAGVWDIQAEIGFTGGTAVTNIRGGTNTTTATISTTRYYTPINEDGASSFIKSQAAGVMDDGKMFPARLNISATTTLYLVAEATFASGSCSAYGSINATRVG